jgi:hypothetical protein
MSIRPDETLLECPCQGLVACCACAMKTGTARAFAPIMIRSTHASFPKTDQSASSFLRSVNASYTISCSAYRSHEWLCALRRCRKHSPDIQVFGAILLRYFQCPVRQGSTQLADRRSLRSRRSRAGRNGSRFHTRHSSGRMKPFPLLVQGHWSNAMLTPCRATAFPARPRCRSSE